MTITAPAAETTCLKSAPARKRDLTGWRWVPLAVILATQVVLTARLIPSAMASPDEARYIYAGHQVIAEWLHGGGSPWYETYFSGSPFIYPPLAAVADHFGGLAAVRLMSTMLMAASTSVLYLTTRRLFGACRKEPGTLAAIMAASLFAGLGLTHDIGAYANYDSLALLLLAAATYCGVRAGGDQVASPGGGRELRRGRPAGTCHHEAGAKTRLPGGDEPATRMGPGLARAHRWLLAVPLLLAAANATKYMTVIFDPVVIAAVAFSRPVTAPSGGARQRDGWWMRALALALATGTLVAAGLALAGGATLQGVLWSTVARKAGTQAVLAATATPAHMIIAESASWIGIPVALAALGVAVSLLRKDRRQARLMAVLAGAGVLVTLEALHLRSDESMRQHDTFGAWFSCIAAGYVLSRLVPRSTRAKHGS